jgi:hypothetical protein
MDLSEEINKLIGQPENELLEYKAVLPPSRNIAQLISAFSNNKGGVIILGIAEVQGKIVVNGLSSDFNADSVTQKAIELLRPKPKVNYQYITYSDKRLYVIKVEKSDLPVSIEGKIYQRQGANIILSNPINKEIKPTRLPAIGLFSGKLNNIRKAGTGAKSKFIDHYDSILNILDDLRTLLYPNSPVSPTTNQEGKILMRILFSSCADNFETYLSDLLYEIYLAKPATLKSNQQISIKEVLDCMDMQEFIIFYAKKKLSKLQRGSVKGFIADNPQINDLKVMDVNQQDNIEKILQIRHLYAHRNGIVDDKFLHYYVGIYNINDEHQLSVNDMLTHLSYLADTVDRIDKAAIQKFHLAAFD